MKTGKDLKKYVILGVVALATISQSKAELSGDKLEVCLKSDAGIAEKVFSWTDQAEAGGTDVFQGKYSAKPVLAKAATPNGKDAVRFNGAKNNPNQLKVKAVDSYKVADGESLSFSMVLKPAELSGGNDTYLQTTLDGRNYAWSLSRGKHGFIAEIRSKDGKRYISMVPSAGLGDAANNWMVLTAVYDGAAKTFQLFLTDASGKTHAGNKVSSASLHSGAHKITTIGTNTDRNSSAGMDLAEVLIYKSALNDTDRVAVEKHLYDTYIKK